MDSGISLVYSIFNCKGKLQVKVAGLRSLLQFYESDEVNDLISLGSKLIRNVVS